MKNLPMDLLRTFIAIVETGGFTSAGNLLGRSQPAISLQVKRLEDMVDAQLFQRTANHELLITEAGETLLKYARQILKLNDAALAHLIKPKNSVSIRLGLPNEFAGSLLPATLGRFLQSYPNVSIDVKCDLSVNLLNTLEKENNFDLVIAIQQNEISASTVSTWQEELVWVGSPYHNTHICTPLPLIVAPMGCVYRNRMTHTLTDIGRPWNIVYTCPSISGIQAAVLAGLGVTVLAKSTVPSGLRILDAEDSLPKLPYIQIGLHYNKEPASNAVMRLAEFVSP